MKKVIVVEDDAEWINRWTEILSAVCQFEIHEKLPTKPGELLIEVMQGKALIILDDSGIGNIRGSEIYNCLKKLGFEESVVMSSNMDNQWYRNLFKPITRNEPGYAEFKKNLQLFLEGKFQG